MAINIENLEKLIDYLKKLKNPETFDMGTWADFISAKLEKLKVTTGGALVKRLIKEGDCGTVACIAGHVRFLARPRTPLRVHDSWMDEYSNETQRIAREWLGLTEDQANTLFLSQLYETGESGIRAAVILLEDIREQALVSPDNIKIDWDWAVRVRDAEANG